MDVGAIVYIGLIYVIGALPSSLSFVTLVV